jgi:putative transposase
MDLVQQIIIKKGHKFWQELDNLCFASKNLYNQALYRLNKEYEENKKYKNYNTLDKELRSEKQIDYCTLPQKVSQQTLMLLDKNYKSFFKSIQDYNINPGKYKGKPKLPKYKNKKTGRFVVVYTNQAISVKEIKKGIIKLSKTNIEIKTDIKDIKQVRIIPKENNIYCIELVYSKQEKQLKENNIFAGGDIGLNNLITFIENNDNKSFIINGKPLKSINQYYNKKLSNLKSKLPHYNNKENVKKQKKSSKNIRKLTVKRNNKVKDYLHKASRKVVNELKQANVSKFVIGLNKQFKTEINIGSKNNQNFVSIPHSQFINMLTYKCKLEGIDVIVREESYTSKCSFLDNENVRKHNKYMGKRVKRGMFVSAKGLKINADVNAAANILRKEIPDAFAKGIEGVLVHPRKLSF